MAGGRRTELPCPARGQQHQDSLLDQFLEVLDDQSDQIVENRFCLLLGDFVTLGERSRQMFQGYGR